jgi:hypothetical protein
MNTTAVQLDSVEEIHGVIPDTAPIRKPNDVPDFGKRQLKCTCRKHILTLDHQRIIDIEVERLTGRVVAQESKIKHWRCIEPNRSACKRQPFPIPNVFDSNDADYAMPSRLGELSKYVSIWQDHRKAFLSQ